MKAEKWSVNIIVREETVGCAPNRSVNIIAREGTVGCAPRVAAVDTFNRELTRLHRRCLRQPEPVRVQV